MSLDMRNPVFKVFKQQRCILDCTSVQSNQCLGYSFIRMYHILTYYKQNFNFLHASVAEQTGLDITWWKTQKTGFDSTKPKYCLTLLNCSLLLVDFPKRLRKHNKASRNNSARNRKWKATFERTDELYPVDMLRFAGSDLKVYIDKKSGSVWDGIKRKCGFYDDGRKENENVCWADASDVFVYSGLSYEYLHEFPNAVLNDNNQIPMKKACVSNLMPTATVTSEDMVDETVEGESNMDDFTPAIGVCGPGGEVWKQPRVSKDSIPTATITSEDVFGKTPEGESNMDEFASAIGVSETGDEFYSSEKNVSVDPSEQYIETIHTDMSQIHADMSQIHTDMSQTVNSNALSKVKTPQSFDLTECNRVNMHKGHEDYESDGELNVQVKYPLKQYVDFYGKQEMINDDLVLVPEELDLSDDQDVVDMNIESLFDTDRHLSLMEENHLDKAGADHFIKPFFATRRPTEDEQIDSDYYENFERGLKRPANVTPFVESLAEDGECLAPVGTAGIDEAETSRTLLNSPAETSTRLASTSTTEVKILKKIYQCDLCSASSEDREIIMTHLREAEHYSASSVLVDGDTPRNTLQQYCIKLEAASYKNPIPVCPHRDCPCIFLHIYASASHYNLFHDEEAEPQYALAELVKEEIIKFDHMVSSCKICSKVFSDRNLLLKHLKATDHFPYSRTENTKPHFLCCHCNHTFDSFLHAGQHVIEKKRKKHFSDIRVMHISFMKVVKKLLPFQSTPLGRRAAVISEVYNLKCLKQNVGRSAKKMINERIKYLRTLIGK